jgi:hypothetical protein
VIHRLLISSIAGIAGITRPGAREPFGLVLIAALPAVACLAGPVCAQELQAGRPPHQVADPSVPPSPADRTLAARHLRTIDIAELEAHLAATIQSPADVRRMIAALRAIADEAGSGEGPAGGLRPPSLATEATTAEATTALVRVLRHEGAPESALNPVGWFLMERRYARVDPGPLFRHLERHGFGSGELRRIAPAQVRVYARERTETAEAQYEPITNSLFIPPDYLEPGGQPPRLKESPSPAEVNTLVHELDHAEKDLLYDDSETYGKSLGGAMLAGIRKFGKWGAAGGFAALALSTIPKLALLLPLAKIGLAIVVGSIVAGAAYGAYQHFFGKSSPPRDARQERVKQAVDGIARAIRSERGQRIHPRVPLTESRSKAWEVTGYFMGDSIGDVFQRLHDVRLHNHLRIRRAKTPEEVERVLRELELPPSLAGHTFGSADNGHSAFFRLKEIGFPYRKHPDLLSTIYGSSLGLEPPRDARELIARINASPAGQFPELRAQLREAADRRIAELQRESGGSGGRQPESAASASPSGPHYEDVPLTPR